MWDEMGGGRLYVFGDVTYGTMLGPAGGGILAQGAFVVYGVGKG